MQYLAEPDDSFPSRWGLLDRRTNQLDINEVKQNEKNVRAIQRSSPSWTTSNPFAVKGLFFQYEHQSKHIRSSAILKRQAGICIQMTDHIIPNSTRNRQKVLNKTKKKNEIDIKVQTLMEIVKSISPESAAAPATSEKINLNAFTRTGNDGMQLIRIRSDQIICHWKPTCQLTVDFIFHSFHQHYHQQQQQHRRSVCRCFCLSSPSLSFSSTRLHLTSPCVSKSKSLPCFSSFMSDVRCSSGIVIFDFDCKFWSCP